MDRKSLYNRGPTQWVTFPVFVRIPLSFYPSGCEKNTLLNVSVVLFLRKNLYTESQPRRKSACTHWLHPTRSRKVRTPRMRRPWLGAADSNTENFQDTENFVKDTSRRGVEVRDVEELGVQSLISGSLPVPRIRPQPLGGPIP